MELSAVRRWWPLAGVTGLLAVAAVAATHSSLRLSRLDEDPLAELPGRTDDATGPPPSLVAQPSAVAEAGPTELPGWLATLATALCVIVVAAVVGLLLWVLIRDVLRRRVTGHMPAGGGVGAPSAAGTAEEVVAALDAGLVDLSDAEVDPRRAVIACWVRLEQAAAAAGTPRRIGDTPTDLVTRLLAAHDVSADVLAAFAHVYRQARYATHTVDERMRGEARSALRRLRAELSLGVARR